MIATSFSFLVLVGSSGGVRSAYSGGGGRANARSVYLDSDAAAVIAGVCLLLLAFIAYKVWRSLKNERKGKRSKREEEAEAFRQLYEDNFGDKAGGAG